MIAVLSVQQKTSRDTLERRLIISKLGRLAPHSNDSDLHESLWESKALDASLHPKAQGLQWPLVRTNKTVHIKMHSNRYALPVVDLLRDPNLHQHSCKRRETVVLSPLK